MASSFAGRIPGVAHVRRWIAGHDQQFLARQSSCSCWLGRSARAQTVFAGTTGAGRHCGLARVLPVARLGRLAYHRGGDVDLL